MGLIVMVTGYGQCLFSIDGRFYSDVISCRLARVGVIVRSVSPRSWIEDSFSSGRVRPVQTSDPLDSVQR